VSSLWVFGALAGVALAGALTALLLFARRIKRRSRRFLGAAQPTASPEGTRIVDAPRALYHATWFVGAIPIVAAEWRAECVCDLWLTEQAVFIQREGGGALLVIAIAEIEDASLLRSFAPIAGKELPMLRLRWQRGGEMLQTDLSLRGGMASLETLRREIHLRQKNIAEKLAPLLQRPLP
jgi:hypothetical protein